MIIAHGGGWQAGGERVGQRNQTRRNRAGGRVWQTCPPTLYAHAERGATTASYCNVRGPSSSNPGWV
jgi:hypothetical protein